MNNKFWVFLCCMIMFLGMVCGNATAEEDPAHLTVITTTYPLYDMACRIGGEHLNVVYQPDATTESVHGASILLCMGSEKEAWTAEVEGITVVRAMDGIALIEGEENILTIPVNNMLVASYFVDALCIADADHSDLYMSNLSVYTDLLISLDMSFRDVISKGTKVYCEDGSFAYFANEYGVEVAETVDGAVLLHTYEYPSEEDLTVSYIDLMQRNLEALIQAQ